MSINSKLSQKFRNMHKRVTMQSWSLLIQCRAGAIHAVTGWLSFLCFLRNHYLYGWLVVLFHFSLLNPFFLLFTVTLPLLLAQVPISKSHTSPTPPNCGPHPVLCISPEWLFRDTAQSPLGHALQQHGPRSLPDQAQLILAPSLTAALQASGSFARLGAGACLLAKALHTLPGLGSTLCPPSPLPQSSRREGLSVHKHFCYFTNNTVMFCFRKHTWTNVTASFLSRVISSFGNRFRHYQCHICQAVAGYYTPTPLLLPLGPVSGSLPPSTFVMRTLRLRIGEGSGQHCVYNDHLADTN